MVNADGSGGVLVRMVLWCVGADRSCGLLVLMVVVVCW